MRLLVLEPDPSFGGGSEAVMLSLARELAGRGHAIVLLHEHAGSMLADYRAFAADVVQATLPGFSLRAPLRTLSCVWRIGRIARAAGADAIVSSHLGFLQHAALLRRLSGVRACFHLGLSLANPPRSLRLALGSAGAGVAPSAHSLESWRAGGWDPRALHLVRNWVDATRFAPAQDRAALRRELGMAPDARHIVFVGRVCRQKGVDTLVGAFGQAAATRPDVQLHLVGPVAPEFREALDAALAGVDAGARTRIHLLPATAHPERFYAAADLACAPSIGDEAFGLTVLEAMSCAVPVVATTIGLVPQLLGDDDAGLLATPGDAASLSNRLAWWIDRPVQSAAAGARLRRRALDAYGPSESVSRYEAILSGLVGADARPRGTHRHNPKGATRDARPLLRRTGDPDRWLPFDRFPRRIVRRLVRGKPRPGGQTRVFLNLVAGLDELGVAYRVNDYRHAIRHPEQLACIVGKPLVLDEIEWRNPILFGASVFSHPIDDPTLFERRPVRKVLVPGPWMEAMCKPYWGSRVQAWPVGIDTALWHPADPGEKTDAVLLYDKVLWDRPQRADTLVQPIRDALAAAGQPVVELRYGSYAEEDFHAALRRCRAMIFLCDHETQGIAYQQALSCGVPILAWDPGGPWRDPSYYPDKVVFGPVSSVPYWDARCGERFVDAAGFARAWPDFIAQVRAGAYQPRQYILENLTLAQCAARYVAIAQAVQAEAQGDLLA